MCTVLMPPGVNLIAVNKYICINMCVCVCVCVRARARVYLCTEVHKFSKKLWANSKSRLQVGNMR
jgi:hypothetical protein